MIDHQKDSAIQPPMESPFPPTETGAGLLLAWQIKGKPVLVIGGGVVAAGRISALLNASAIITLISPYEGLSPEVLWRLEVEKTITTYHDRTYAGKEDLEGFEMVLTAIDQAGLSSEICVICRELRIAVNVADVPPECDFYFGSIVRRKQLQIMVSTGGNGPRIANRVRRSIEENLPLKVGEAIESVGRLRNALRVKAPQKDVETIARRMEWMIRVCDLWSLNDLAAMTPEQREEILDGWEDGVAKTIWEVKGWGFFGRALGRLGVGRCPVAISPDGKKSRCPFILGTSSFLMGMGSLGLGLFIAKKLMK